MSHPFFDAVKFPWDHRPEADDLLRVLGDAITNVGEINTLFQAYGPKLEALNLQQGPHDIWREVLTRLTAAGQLRNLCVRLAQHPTYRRNEGFQDAVLAVMNATSPEPAPTPARTLGPVPPCKRWPVVGGIALALGLTVGVLAGLFWGSTPTQQTGMNAPDGKPPNLPAPPAVTVFEPNDPALRARLSDAELTFLEKNVDNAAGTTVLVADVGPWAVAGRAQVHVRPAEYAAGKEPVYQKAHAALKGANSSLTSAVAWDADGVLTIRDVDGKAGDHLYVFVVIPVTKSSEPLLSDPRTMKRFLCVEVTP